MADEPVKNLDEYPILYTAEVDKKVEEKVE
jgi:hypothetical protein